MKRLVLALAVFAGAAHSQSVYLTGQELYNRLQSSSSVERSMAIGYVAGVHDAFSNSTICIPPNAVTLGQMADMVEQSLRRLPSERHQSADIFVLVALSDRWPCAKKKGSAL